LLIAILVAACGSVPVIQPAGVPKSVAELKYAVIAATAAPFICGGPVVRAGGDEESARAEFATIKADSETYRAIIAHAHPAGAESSTEYQLAVWQQWRELQGVGLSEPDAAGVRDFTVRAARTRYQGTVDAAAKVAVNVSAPTFPPACPICLAAGTLIDTPSGPRPVATLRIGDVVWTVGQSGHRVAAPLAQVGSVPFPRGRTAVDLQLTDGRRLVVSAGHPMADGRLIGSLRPGDPAAGSTVLAAGRISLGPGSTYDILPAGPTGRYWADGILLGSTLAVMAHH